MSKTKKPLSQTNPYLKDPAERKAMIIRTSASLKPATGRKKMSTPPWEEPMQAAA
jgi:hypothetical protein